MSSAFFRRPGEDSSSSDSESSAEEVEIEEPSTKDTEGDLNSNDIELATTESIPTDASVALPHTDEDRNVLDVDQHRNNMLTALLEDYYKNRATDLLNSTHPDASFTRDSAEVQALARELYSDASHTLAQNGIIPSPHATNSRSAQNRNYLSVLDSIALRNIKDVGISRAQQNLQLREGDASLALVGVNKRPATQHAAYSEASLGNLIMSTGHMGISSPHADRALTVSRPQQQSHYESSFQQLKLLGKGGFGRVYHAHSLFDRKEYAIKKIPLSPRLTRSYQQGGHAELDSVLREVQALAQLDHSNVVRYHATWIEEPRSSPRLSSGPMHTSLPLNRRRLLADRPHESPRPALPEQSEGIVFGFDSSRRPSYANDVASGWSIDDALDKSTSIRESQIFTDGLVQGSASTESNVDDTVCVLHVQMSLYPMTLSQYLAPLSATASSAPGSPQRRHCFHLVPSLRIILGILCGLQYIHAKGLIHRDIKPGNIFLSHVDQSTGYTTSEGFYDVGSCSACPDYHEYHVNPRIGDFGLVAELARSDVKIDSPTSPSSSPAKLVGTEYYRPPQPTDGDGHKAKPAVDEKVDVYAMGVILVELLWQCNTSSERLHVLRDLQRGRLPKALAATIESEGHEPGLGETVKDCIRGMIVPDDKARWTCLRVEQCIQDVLRKCKTRMDVTNLTKVRCLNGTEDSAGATVEVVDD
ncbi:uncharacterized protein HMPREF1541_03871 [Cyphellophora europaea CBS 101466]|uniref:non-specific serine/threonine protein kinase n=1 Tax=Cyphellophora europaea (strain CBS 101466) TaxID=1220924 RepID=W2RZT7_CYPE1|nr:uncharacterized protein HMPREF1541_03871 [Cyphellophora europaea CBS 101466]ETN41932.1 hypothetical protein HMPREF1541_03871 [Cyphellophora europaea CBS 101466]